MISEDDVSNWQKRLDRLADERQREQTAATILAALATAGGLRVGRPLDDDDRSAITYAVDMADALRAELAKVKP